MYRLEHTNLQTVAYVNGKALPYGDNNHDAYQPLPLKLAEAASRSYYEAGGKQVRPCSRRKDKDPSDVGNQELLPTPTYSARIVKPYQGSANYNLEPQSLRNVANKDNAEGNSAIVHERHPNTDHAKEEAYHGEKENAKTVHHDKESNDDNTEQTNRNAHHNEKNQVENQKSKAVRDESREAHNAGVKSKNAAGTNYDSPEVHHKSRKGGVNSNDETSLEKSNHDVSSTKSHESEANESQQKVHNSNVDDNTESRNRNANSDERNVQNPKGHSNTVHSGVKSAKSYGHEQSQVDDQVGNSNVDNEVENSKTKTSSDESVESPKDHSKELDIAHSDEYSRFVDQFLSTKYYSNQDEPNKVHNGVVNTETQSESNEKRNSGKNSLEHNPYKNKAQSDENNRANQKTHTKYSAVNPKAYDNELDSDSDESKSGDKYKTLPYYNDPTNTEADSDELDESDFSVQKSHNYKHKFFAAKSRADADADGSDYDVRNTKSHGKFHGGHYGDKNTRAHQHHEHHYNPNNHKLNQAHSDESSSSSESNEQDSKSYETRKSYSDELEDALYGVQENRAASDELNEALSEIRKHLGHSEELQEALKEVRKKGKTYSAVLNHALNKVKQHKANSDEHRQGYDSQEDDSNVDDSSDSVSDNDESQSDERKVQSVHKNSNSNYASRNHEHDDDSDDNDSKDSVSDSDENPKHTTRKHEHKASEQKAQGRNADSSDDDDEVPKCPSKLKYSTKHEREDSARRSVEDSESQDSSKSASSDNAKQKDAKSQSKASQSSESDDDSDSQSAEGKKGEEDDNEENASDQKERKEHAGDKDNAYNQQNNVESDDSQRRNTKLRDGYYLPDPAKGPGITPLSSSGINVVQNKRVCYACSSEANLSCHKPNILTTVKYCHGGVNNCVSKTYTDRNHKTVVIRDCGNTCNSASDYDPAWASCDVCTGDLCNDKSVNGAFSIKSQSLLFTVFVLFTIKFTF
ncbi:dentin sialophosphoprotein-like [Ostrinia nubilalis]|uniref:dentin sialophosphoprotein-like n=1 Tax=Ostrinia nubilalis TaxID=29057 RepID=UPI0030823D99